MYIFISNNKNPNIIPDYLIFAITIKKKLNFFEGVWTPKTLPAYVPVIDDSTILVDIGVYTIQTCLKSIEVYIIKCIQRQTKETCKSQRLHFLETPS